MELKMAELSLRDRLDLLSGLTTLYSYGFDIPWPPVHTNAFDEE